VYFEGDKAHSVAGMSKKIIKKGIPKCFEQTTYFPNNMVSYLRRLQCECAAQYHLSLSPSLLTFALKYLKQRRCRIHYRNYWIYFSSYIHVYDCSFALFQVETVNTILMNVRNHQNRATMAYVSTVWVCIIESNIKMDRRETGLGGLDSVYPAQDMNH
jgi:hypothetical protein